jgi:cytosine deaminase
MVKRGTVAARVHVEIDLRWGLDTVAAHVDLARAWHDRILLQLVAFPQNGLAPAGTVDLLAAALDAGCEVVGACPYADDDPVAHVDAVFDLAVERDLPLDFHVDLSDDPSVAVVDVISARTQQHRRRGKVVVGHVTSLAAAPPGVAAGRMTAMAAAGVSVVSLPATDLYLGGRAATHAVPRAVAPLPALLAHGVPVAVATNNTQNAFTPYGNGGLLPVAWLAGLVNHLPPGRGHDDLLAMVTAAPAGMLGLPGGTIRVGGPADLVVIDATDPRQAVSGPADVLAVFRQGRLVSGRLP